MDTEAGTRAGAAEAGTRAGAAEAGTRKIDAETGAQGDSAEEGMPGRSIEPGMPGNPVKLTDPKMMRALAHPARIAIWTHIAMRGSATATECAEVAGLSPSACSYHLRSLARYGFVEEDRPTAPDNELRRIIQIRDMHDPP